MVFRRPFLILLACIVPAAFSACGTKNRVNPRLDREMPKKIVWAWERPEDLRFLDPQRFGVAFLAQTLTLQRDEVVIRPRRQPLELPDGIYLIAVTRIETLKESGSRPALSAEQRKKIVDFVKKTLNLPNVRAVQIDFDAVVSERGFYRGLIGELKKELPANTPLTMTSLASWCVGDNWFNDFPVDEAVPMAFEMGADSDRIRDFLAKENDWREPLCRGSYGFSVDDPVTAKLKPERRIYFFKSKSWDQNDLEKIENFGR
ncbi:MAG: hypothetical protein JSS81_21220 [Acidobacteria bacterium]|nr:hypothetical protein [Acidobacteriota bacterium]